MTGAIESRDDFKPSPSGQYDYWQKELRGAQERLREWHKRADRIVRFYVDSRGGQQVETQGIIGGVRLNLFHSNINTLQAMLYGNVPKVDVSRRYADPKDDVSRVAAEIMQRILNADFEGYGDGATCVLRSCLQDRLLPGLGCARVRYELETSKDEDDIEQMEYEEAPIDYFHWRDVLWGWARNWHELPWLAYRAWMTRDEVAKRFGDEIAGKLQYQKQGVSDPKEGQQVTNEQSIWQKAEIWEIWDKTKRKVSFVSLGYENVLEEKDDPLELSCFYPSPPFFIANPTTSLYVPTPDFHLASNLYTMIDELQTRIEIITTAVKVVGVYDSNCSESIGRMFKEGTDNQLIPVDSWAIFAEKGGLQGSIQWIPLADIVAGLDKLREMRTETINLLYQVTGLSDVLRGGGEGQYEGTGQAALKAKFASIRVQALQEEFATFASNLMSIKAEVVCKHFSPQTIATLANIENTFDRDLAPAAIDLLKNYPLARLRVSIKPESVAMTDFAQLKTERTEYINALAVFMQSAAPLIEQDPAVRPYLMQLLQWGLSGFKGAQEIEGVLDRAIEEAEKARNEPQQDPAAAAQLAAQQAAMALEQQRAQTKLAEIQAKAEADLQLRLVDRDADIATAQHEHECKLAETQAELQSALAQTAAKLEADVLVEQVKGQTTMQQNAQAVQGEMIKDAAAHQMDIDKTMTQTLLNIKEMATDIEGKKELQNESKGDEDED